MQKDTPIVIISDSLAMPRPDPFTEINTTYPYLLQNKYNNVFACSYGGSTSKNILHQVGYFDGIMNQGICILHFGVVDCYPRVFSVYESRLLKILKLQVPKKIANWILKKRLIRDVSPQDFRLNCIEIKKKKLGNLIVLAIFKSPDNNQHQSPYINNSIDEYNKILNDVFEDNFFDVRIVPSDEISSDCIHLNQKGHFKVYSSLVDRIEKILGH